MNFSPKSYPRNRNFLLLFLLMSILGQAQVVGPDYFMSNGSSSDCTANFFDSNSGTPPVNYAHNENLTFVICVPQATQITFSFLSFCTEPILDYIRFFDGPDTLSPLIGGPFSGNVIPPNVVATSGCLTINFISDLSVACTGWDAFWYSEVPPPPQPLVSSISGTCNSNLLQVQLDRNVHCDSLYPGNFSVGNSNQLVTAITPNPCIGDSTNAFTVTLDSPFDDCAAYTLDFQINIPDACDSVYEYIYSEPFAINDCPLEALATLSADSICVGDCVTITGDADGGDCNYVYAWSWPLPNTPGPHVICPVMSGTITFIVIDGQGLIATYSIDILVSEYPTMPADTMICISDSPFNIIGATPPGGQWSGTGITNGSLGTFNPGIAGQGVHVIYYDNNNCMDSMLITVFEVFAGPDQASCEGAPPFQLVGNLPPGGYYLGSNVDSAGIFTPTVNGIYTVYYHYLNCLDSLVVNVDSIALQPMDTLCETAGLQQLVFSPFGGTWSGPGIADSLAGVFDPDVAGGGVHTLVYDINGCQDSIQVPVTGIFAGNDRTACPYQDTIVIPFGSPAGGYWTGVGIVDSTNRLFWPGLNGATQWNSNLVYHVNGCTDTIIMRVRFTDVTVTSIETCETDTIFLLNFDNTGRTPGGGTWAGPGVVVSNANGQFDPLVAGPGTHTLVYTANTCTDSMQITVYAQPVLADTVICEDVGVITLSSNVAGGVWSGTGISNALTGTFNPQLAGNGNHTVYYDIYGACMDSMVVQVDTLPQISFLLIDSSYCFVDSVIDLALIPVGGTLSGPGAVGDDFNPSLAGTGTHWLVYTVDNGLCSITDSIQVIVGDTLRSFTNFDSLSVCYGNYVTLQAQAQGGVGGNYSYQWNHGLPNGQSQFVGPLTNSDWYIVTVSDGCSQPVADSIWISVAPEIVTTTITSPRICRDSIGYAQVVAQSGANYSYAWSTTPVQTSPLIDVYPGTYYVQITDLNTGCTAMDTAIVPGFSQLSASFSVSPNQECILLSQASVTLIDFSLGGTYGTWDFGDGFGTTPYQLGQYPSYTYTDTGFYVITLVLENEGGCLSFQQRTVCIELDPVLYVPNAFTPNGDFINDGFKAVGGQIEEYEMFIYDRWGKLLFYTNEIEEAWNGTFENEDAQSGQYLYRIRYKHYDLPDVQDLQGKVYLIR
jgi:gliding motility-associated-like protein